MTAPDSKQELRTWFDCIGCGCPVDIKQGKYACEECGEAYEGVATDGVLKVWEAGGEVVATLQAPLLCQWCDAVHLTAEDHNEHVNNFHAAEMFDESVPADEWDGGDL